LIGWDNNVLCFIEVTRTTRDVKPAEAAVDREKQKQINLVSPDYLRHLPLACQWRLDVLSVYYSDATKQPRFELFQNTQAVS